MVETARSNGYVRVTISKWIALVFDKSSKR